MRLNYFQDRWANNANTGGLNVYFNLKNEGGRTLTATPSDPIIIEYTIHHLSGTMTSAAQVASGGNGTSPVSRTVSIGAYDPATRTTKVTMRITGNINNGAEPDALVRMAGNNGNVYVTATMTSFGPNDDLTAASFETMDQMGLSSSQQTACQTYYSSQVTANSGAHKATYTFLADGKTSSEAWQQGTAIDSRAIGNWAPANNSAPAESTDGIW